MNHRSSASVDLDLLRVAELYYNHDMTQEQIASQLMLTRWKVGRMLRDARERGVVQIKIVHPHARVRNLEQALCERYGLADAVVVPAQADSAEELRTVARAAAEYLSDLRPHPTRVGVSWGRSMDELAAHIPPGWANGVEVVQINGAVTQSRGMSGGLVATELARQGPGTARVLPAPAIVEKAATRQVIVSDPSVRQALVNGCEAEVLVFSLGALSQESVLVESGYLVPKDVARLRTMGAVGDILGRFIDADGREVSAELSERTVAIELADIRAAQTSIAVAAGLHKLSIARAAVANGLCTVLVTESDVASGLLHDGLVDADAGVHRLDSRQEESTP